MRILTIIFLMALLIPDVEAQFPRVFPLNNSQPPTGELIGKVKTVLTTSYRSGELLGYITNEMYSADQKLRERVAHSADIEIHSGKFIRFSQIDYIAYDNLARIENLKTYDSTGKLIKEEKYVYDDGAVIPSRIDVYRSGAKTQETYEISYNQAKRTVFVESINFYDSRRVSIITSLIFNNKNQLTERIISGAKGVLSKTVYDYDSKGQLIKSLGVGSYTAYEYQFDEKGNWIERKETYWQKGSAGEFQLEYSTTTLRVLTYF